MKRLTWEEIYKGKLGEIMEDLLPKDTPGIMVLVPPIGNRLCFVSSLSVDLQLALLKDGIETLQKQITESN